MVSYYLNKILTDLGIEDEDTKLVINGVLNIWNMLVATTFAFFVDRFGRRPLFLTSTAGMLLMFIPWTIASKFAVEDGNLEAGKVVIAFIFLYFTCYNLAWSGLLVGYTVEILPFEIRAKGMAVVFFFVNLALFFNNYVNPIAMDAINWKYYIVYCCWLAVELAFVYFFFVETRYTPLEEIAKYFDGDEARVGGAAATDVAREKLAQLEDEGKLTTTRTADDARVENVEQKV